MDCLIRPKLEPRVELNENLTNPAVKQKQIKREGDDLFQQIQFKKNNQKKQKNKKKKDWYHKFNQQVSPLETSPVGRQFFYIFCF